MASFETFFKTHYLFHHDELVDYINGAGGLNNNTLKAALQYHVAKQHIARIRRGYYVVRNHYLPGIHVEGDRLLIAGRMSGDAIISYHSAMEFHALSYSVSSITYFNSDQRIGFFNSEYGQYQQLAHPSSLKPNNIFAETKLHDRIGMDIRVTSIERTLVDCMNRPELSGGWEEIWRSFGSINFLDIERLISYSTKLCNATTIAKVGFFLEQHQKQFSVTEKQLGKLSRHKPKTRHYMDKTHKGHSESIKRWNLIVPLSVINQSWEESYNDYL